MLDFIAIAFLVGMATGMIVSKWLTNDALNEMKQLAAKTVKEAVVETMDNITEELEKIKSESEDIETIKKKITVFIKEMNTTKSSLNKM